MTSPAALVARLAAMIGVLLSGLAAFVPITEQTFTGSSDDREPFVLVTFWWSLVTRFPEGQSGGETAFAIVVFVLLGGVLAALVVPHVLLFGGEPARPSRLDRWVAVVYVAAGGCVAGAILFTLANSGDSAEAIHWLPIGALVVVAVLYAVVYVPAIRLLGSPR